MALLTGTSGVDALAGDLTCGGAGNESRHGAASCGDTLCGGDGRGGVLRDVPVDGAGASGHGCSARQRGAQQAGGRWPTGRSAEITLWDDDVAQERRDFAVALARAEVRAA